MLNEIENMLWQLDRRAKLLRFILYKWQANRTDGLVDDEVMAQGVEDLLDESRRPSSATTGFTTSDARRPRDDAPSCS